MNRLRWAIVLLALSVSLAAQTGHGEWANVEGQRCWHQPTEVVGATTFHQCPCEQLCHPDGTPYEDTRCLTYCGSAQCVCHADTSMCQPPVQEPKR